MSRADNLKNNSQSTPFERITKTGPESSKIEIVAAQIRSKILSGQLKPLAQLPTRDDLIPLLGVSRNTLQKAMDQLIQSGFLTASNSGGTCVSPHPPHLSHYGVVFSHNPGEDQTWPDYVKLFRSAALGRMYRTPTTFSFYYFDDHRSYSDDLQKLIHDLDKQCLAGLIFTSHPSVLFDSAIFKNDSIPKVCVINGVLGPNTASIFFDLNSFFSQAVKTLKARGRSRLALIGLSPVSLDTMDPFRLACETENIEMIPTLIHTVPMNQRDLILSTVNLLMSLPEHQRPDGFIFTDDHLNEAAVVALSRLGNRLGTEVDAVLQMNSPLMRNYPLPILRLGWDIQRMFDESLTLIQSMRLKKNHRPLTLMPPAFW